MGVVDGMERKPKFIKSFLGTLFLLAIIYLVVYQFTEKEEVLLTNVLRGVQIEAEQSDKQILILAEGVDIEVTGTEEMMKKLDRDVVKATVEVEETEPETGEKETEEREEVKNYKTILTVTGLEGYIYKPLTEVDVEVSDVVGEKLDLTVKVKGKVPKEIKELKISEEVFGYFTEEDREDIADVGVYVDLTELGEETMIEGEIRLRNKTGDIIEVNGRLDKEYVKVEVVYVEGS